MSPKVTPSRLESLPAEIIQKIFLHSLEFNLPRASITLSRILSSPIIYTWIIRLAFSSDNRSSRSGFFTRDYLPDEVDFFALTTDQRTNLQNAVLKCRWCTLPLMRQCQQDYVAHVLRQKCSNLIFSPDDQHTLSNVSNIFTAVLDQSSCDLVSEDMRDKGYIAIPANMLVREKAAEGEEENLREQKMNLVLWLHHGAIEIRSPGPLYFNIFRDVFRLPSFSATSPARIPDKLLNPPWTESKLKFLRLLSRGAYIDENIRYDRSKHVLRELIRQRDFVTFEKLLDIVIRRRDYSYAFPWPLCSEHYHDAIYYTESGNLEDPFLRVLFEERWSDMPAFEDSLLDYALERGLFERATGDIQFM